MMGVKEYMSISRDGMGSCVKYQLRSDEPCVWSNTVGREVLDAHVIATVASGRK